MLGDGHDQVKQHIRAHRDPDTEAMSMNSIRDYGGTIYLCGDCGQPADEDSHFYEQWDGVGCPQFPMSGETIVVDWDPRLLDEIKRCYPNPGTMTTTPAGDDPRFYILPQDSPEWIDRYGL